MVHSEVSHSKRQNFHPAQKKNGYIEHANQLEDKDEVVLVPTISRRSYNKILSFVEKIFIHLMSIFLFLPLVRPNFADPGCSCERQQTTDTVVMVRPRTFQFNTETADSNSFQNNINVTNEDALREWIPAVAKLRSHNIRVIVIPSRDDVETPDAIFPDWFSVHTTDNVRGRVLFLYPMFARNRRLELQPNKLITTLKRERIEINEINDLSPYVEQSMFLEGKGSLVLDRITKTVYATISPRTDPRLVNIFAEKLNYTPVLFRSYDDNNELIYHTDVVLCIGTKFAVISPDSIPSQTELATILGNLKASGREIITITKEQVNNYAGNIIELKSTCGQPKIVMSCVAYNSYTPEQLTTLSKYGKFIVLDIGIIEEVGGGSCHCIVTEIF